MERSSLGAFMTRLRGKQNRALISDSSYRQRGSFPSQELILNNTFGSGTTNWTGTNATLTVADRILRSTRTGNTVSENDVTYSPAITGTAYAPYVLRAFVSSIRGAELPAAYLNLSPASTSSTPTAAVGYRYASGVPGTTSLGALIYGQAITGPLSGDFFEIPWVSMSQCALSDSGINLLTFSDQFDNAAWTLNNMTAVANAHTAPDGTVTAESLRETATTSTHFATQAATVSAAATDVCAAVAVNPGTRTWTNIILVENTGGTALQAYFNLSTGAVGTTVVGANWSNLRTFSVNLGNGWFYFCLIGRKTNAATSVSLRVAAASANGTDSYLGVTGSTAIAPWRATLAMSSVPVRLTQTTTVVSNGTAPTGNTLRVKGLPASTNGLLLQNDQFEIITSRGSELKIVDSPLNSDAAGLGYLQFNPPIRGTLSDSSPIIFNTPFARMICTSPIEVSNDPGLVSTASAEFEEA
jgi:hypothetical protein